MAEWKDVPGWKGVYIVSDSGEIVRLSRDPRKPDRTRKPYNHNGYLQMLLSNRGCKQTIRVHRVVAEAFLGPCPEGCEVNHKNGDKADNRVENLEWITHSENIQHSVDVLNREHVRGEAHGRSKFTKEDVLNIREVYSTGTFSMGQLATRYGVSQPAIWKIINRISWTHV